MKNILGKIILTGTLICSPMVAFSEVTEDKFTGEAICTGMVFPQTSGDHVVAAAFRYMKIDEEYLGPYLVLQVTSARPAGLGSGEANFLFSMLDGSVQRLRGEVAASSGSGAVEVITYMFDDESEAESIFSASVNKIEYRLSGSRGKFEGEFRNAMYIKMSLDECSGKDWPK